MRFEGVLAAACFSAVLGLAQVAAAAEAVLPPSMEWEAPEGCPDAVAVYERLSVVLGHAPVQLGGFRHARGVIVEAPPEWQLTLVLTDGTRQHSRVIRAPHCADLAEAAAVAIALALDAEAPMPAPAASGAARVQDTPDVREMPSSPPSIEAELGGVLDLSSLPSPAAGLSALGRLRWGATSLALHALLLPPDTEVVRSDRFVEFALMTLGARACQRAFEGQLYGAACLGFEVGRLQAEGSGLIGPRRVQDWWLAPSAAIELGVPLWSGLALELHAEAVRPLVRRPYVVNDREPVYRVPGVASRLLLGAVWRWD